MADRLPNFLPDDLAAIVLRDLPLRDLAVCRSVCKAWRAIIEEGGRLRSDLLPLSVGGIYIGQYGIPAPQYLLAPPNSKIPGELESFVRMDDPWYMPLIYDCCNGLLLLDGQVVNPATRQWAPVPPSPVSDDVFWNEHLVFDPTLSPHYDIVFFHGPSADDGSAEWPPPTCTMFIYSSATGRWEEKPFAREGGPAETITKELLAQTLEYPYAVCWRGALYVHCRNGFVMRIIIPNRKYQAIKLPTSQRYQVQLAKSKHGVYFASVSDVYSQERCAYNTDFVRADDRRLQVWLLNNTEWVLKYDINLKVVIQSFSRSTGKAGDAYNEEGNFEWDDDSDHNGDDVVLETEGKRDHGYVFLLGFHPFKEVVFLYQISPARILACHLDSLMVRELGRLRLPYGDFDKTFVYTPCYIGDLSQHKY